MPPTSPKAPLGDARVQRVVALTCAEPPGEAPEGTGRAMAKTAGISLRSVQRICAKHDRTFKRSSDPELAAKLADIVGLCLDPPEYAIVLSTLRRRTSADPGLRRPRRTCA